MGTDEYRPEEALAGFVRRAWPPAVSGLEDLVWEPLVPDGSDRSFVRVRTGAQTAVVVWGPDAAENRSYELIGRHLWGLGRLGPEFLAVDQRQGLFLLEDLGSTWLCDAAGPAGEADRAGLYREVIEVLAELHGRGAEGFDPGWCYQTARYDRGVILERETGYFLWAFVQEYLGWEGGSPALASEFEALAGAALAGAETVLIHRDFQSRNVMLKAGRPRLVDFQGARLGPGGYDLASLLFDPYVNLSPSLRARLRADYVQARQRRGGFAADDFEETFPFLAVCRLLQALGAFGFLSRVKGRPWFAAAVPAALRTLEGLLQEERLGFLAELRALVGRIRRAGGGEA